MEHRTEDVSYGPDYWDSMDSGRGYQDSVMWEDIAHIVKELFCYDYNNRKDISLEMFGLDVGCAKGYLVRHLRRRYVNMFGIDFAQYALDNAAEDVRDVCYQHDLVSDTPLPMPGRPFDFITCVEVMEHIPETSDLQVLRKIREAVQPGGKALFTICTSEQDNPFHDPTHINIKPREYWQQNFIDAGWKTNDSLVEYLRSNFWLFHYHPGIFVVEN